jgi:membrane protein DedA with SNARE-associated domain
MSAFMPAILAPAPPARARARTLRPVTMPLASFGDWVRDLVSTGGYPALALLILVENLFPPIPSEIILPLAGFYVGTGELHYVWALLAATVGAVAGALIIYAIARHGGRPLLLRHGRLLRLREKDLDRADDWFDRHGAWIVFFGRLVPGLRSVVSVPAGLSEMPPARFVALTAAGSAMWNAALIGAGWALGNNYDKVGGIVGPVSTVVTIGLVLALVALGVWLARRRVRRRAAG